MKTFLAPLAAALHDPPPWLLRYASLAQRIVRHAASQSVATALNHAHSGGTAPVQFVDQAMLPSGEAYESFIARTGCVPTRENLHDLFNGLMWLSYPLTKRRLNALHAQEIVHRGTTGPRGALRDALTVFDENAAILQAPPQLLHALQRRDWHNLFVAQRAQWQAAGLAIFGHALLEKLLQPRKEITAHVWLVEDLTDEAMASSLGSDRLARKDFAPLPVLGVPGWWPANEAPEFYADAEVFRAARA